MISEVSESSTRFGLGPVEIRPGLEDGFVRAAQRMPFEEGALVLTDACFHEIVVSGKIGLEPGLLTNGSCGFERFGRRSGELLDGENPVGEGDFAGLFGGCFFHLVRMSME